MTVPQNLNRAVGLFAALLLGALLASPSAARDGTLTVAQNPEEFDATLAGSIDGDDRPNCAR